MHWKLDFEAIGPILSAEGSLLPAKAARIAHWHELLVHPLSFSYDAEKQQLREVSLRLARKRKIALIGESGCGKSTLLQLLRGLSSSPEARLTVDGGITLPLSALAGTTTLIPQEPEIFENTIRHNVTMGIPASEEELRHALRVAAFDRVVTSLPQGLESDIREKGVNLSGGEKQRLALARGVFSIRDSSIVLLDEPTSNLDPGTELAIFDRLFATLTDQCVVSALHRLHLFACSIMSMS